MNNKILKNYQEDIIKSKYEPLLIELNNNDLNIFSEVFKKEFVLTSEESNFSKHINLGLNLSLLIAKEIYDYSLTNKSTTNIIYIDTDKNAEDKNSILLEQIIEQIDDSLKKLYNLEIAKETIKAILSVATSGIDKLFKSQVDTGMNYLIDTITEKLGDYIANTVIDKAIHETVRYSLDEINNKILSKISTKTIDILDNLKDSQIYLSKESKDRLLGNSRKFTNSLSNAELYQLIIKIIIDLSIDMPMIVFVKNPHKLDLNSISIISLLLSVSKNMKDENKHTGISIIYAYEDEKFQPYQECEENYKINQKLLNEQRIFAQRYSMLERPFSDIPYVAVKSHIFVGRTKELKILKDNYYISKENKKKGTMEVIAADPGIGKTKLAKKHFEQIRKEEKNGQLLIQLTLLNQVGHNSLNIGLGSLINSILEEAERLKNLKSFMRKSIDKVKEKAFETMFNSLKEILDTGTMDIGKAIYDRVNVDQKMSNFSKINLESNDYNNKKEKQFVKINQAIKKLESISDNSMPIILFIDDLQWIDDTSSEYILKHFVKFFNVHIVSTLRSSDATSMLKKALENKSINKYKIALLERANILIDKLTNTEINIEKLIKESDKEFICNRFELMGLDKEVLTTLISQIIEGDNEQHKILSKLIFNTLNNSNKERVNTLFAIETINMLCDEKFYKDSEHLIIKNYINSKIPMKFNQQISDFAISLENTFKTLKNKYQDAFEQSSNQNFIQNFNLMAYAVLEERLNILKIYFVEYGNAALNTLFLSSLLGTPFNSNIIKKVLEKLSSTEEVSLQLLKKYLTKNSDKINLLPEHYEIIDEVYEILNKYINFNNSYSYRHSLFEIFLNKQLKLFFLNLFPESLRKESIDKFYEILYQITIEEENTENSFSELISKKNEVKNTSLLHFDLMKMNILRNAYINDDKWFPEFSYILNKCVVHYKNYLELNTAIELLEEVKTYEITSKYLNDYLISINNLAELYISTKQIDKAQNLLVDILKYFTNENISSLSYIYINIINNLSVTYHLKFNSIEAIRILENTKQLIENSIEKNYVNDSLIEFYTVIMSNLSVYYKEVNFDKSLKYEEVSFTFIKKYFNKSREKWALLYIKRGVDLASLLKNKKPKMALKIIEEILLINEEFLRKDESFWLQHYVKTLNVYGLVISKKYKNKKLEIFQNAVTLSYKNFEKEKIVTIWTELYIQSLSNLSNEYIEYDNNQALIYFNELVKIQKKLYENNPILWGKEYLYTIRDIAGLKFSMNNILETIILLENSLVIVQNLYKLSLEFKNEYIKTLMTLLNTSKDNIKNIYWEKLLFELIN